jgi:hypothetical protein
MATLSNEQIEQKQQLKQLMKDANAIASELQETGAWPLSDEDLENVAGGGKTFHPAFNDNYIIYNSRQEGNGIFY